MARIATVGDGDMDVYNNLGTSYPGGNAVNVGVHLFRLGVETAFVGAVGDDEYGRRVIEKLAADNEQVDWWFIEGDLADKALIDSAFEDYKFDIVVNLAAQAGVRYSITNPDAYICTYDLVHSAMWGMVHDDLHLIRERGVPVSFDFADKLEDNPVTEVAIENCDYAIFSYTEDDTYIRDYLRRMHARGPKVALATLGGNGSVAFDGERFVTCGIVPVEVVDTMGAGDSYIAGFITGIARGLSLEESMRLGAETASETITYMGAW